MAKKNTVRELATTLGLVGLFVSLMWAINSGMHAKCHPTPPEQELVQGSDLLQTSETTQAD